MQVNANVNNDPELTENEVPQPGGEARPKEPSHHEKTRTSLAKVIVYITLGLYCAVIVSHLISGGDRFDSLAQTALGGAQSLLGIVVGFYFAQVVSLEK